MTAAEFRKAFPLEVFMRISSCCESPVGRICVEEDGENITRIYMAHRGKPCAENGETPLLKEAVRQLSEYFSGERTSFDLPVMPAGTEFQRTVWDVLKTIPFGETRAYKEVAAAAGNPKGCRAVGMANNRNPVMIVIPCHRVIGSDGSLTGYAGGLDVKEKLLRLEAEYSGRALPLFGI